MEKREQATFFLIIGSVVLVLLIAIGILAYSCSPAPTAKLADPGYLK